MAEGWPGVVLRTDTGSEAKKYPWRFGCTQPNCYYNVCAKTEEEARNVEATHKCPSYANVKYSAEITMTLVGQMWEMADKAYEDFINADLSVVDGDKYNQMKGRLRGHCDMLAIFMQPHFRTSDEIGREVVKRSRAKLGGDTEYETAGLGGRRFEMPGTDKPRAGGNVPAAKITKVEPVLSEENKKAILFALDSGMFTPEQVAKTYKVSVETINSLKS